MRKLMPNRKGDLTINTIIVAAIGLLVLVVLIAVFTGRLGAFTKQVGDTQEGILACQNICRAINMDGGVTAGTSCNGLQQPGKFKTLLGAEGVCCCTEKGGSSANQPAVSGDQNQPNPNAPR
jgi:hypothetical protein